MKIILKYIYTNMKEKKMRMLVMLLSIVLSTMLLFVSFSIGASYESAQRKMARGMAGTATISVSPANQEDVIYLEDIPDISLIQEKMGMLKQSAVYHENGYYETIDLMAADLEQLNKINKPRLISGEEISDFEGNKVILPERFTSKYEIQKGDQITFEIGGSTEVFEVADIAVYDTVFLRQTRGASALLPENTLADLLQKGNGYNEILLVPQDGITTEALWQALAAELSQQDVNINIIVREAQIQADARQKTMPFFLISFFSLTMSIFIIYSSYKVITLDRLPVIGTFRSIGATQRIVTGLLVMESALYGLLGGIVGIVLGIPVLKIILQGMGNSLNQGMEIPLVIRASFIIFSGGMAILVSMLSALIPVCRASAMPIKNIVLGFTEEKKKISLPFGVAGVLLLIVSVLLPKAASEKMLFWAGGFSLLGMIVATILLIPIATNIISKGLEVIYPLVFGKEGFLAARNMQENKNIAQNITLLFISISSVIAITVVGNFVTTYITDVFDGATLQGFADGEMDEEFVSQVKKMEGIDKVLLSHVINNQVRCGEITFARLETTNHLEWYNEMLHLIYPTSEMEEAAVSAFEQKRSIVLSEDCLARSNLSVGDTITLEYGQTVVDYTIVGSFKSRATDVEAIIPQEYGEVDFSLTNYNFLAYTAQNPDAVMIQIRDLFGSRENWSRTVEEFNTDALTTVGSFLQPMHSMTYFILLLATVGIVNNLLINYMQKRHATAMYKSVGMSNRQNIKMTVLESLTSGIMGSIIAAVISYLEIQTIFIVAGPKISMVPELHLQDFVLAGCMGVIITLIGSLMPIIKNKNMNLVEEIKFE